MSTKNLRHLVPNLLTTANMGCGFYSILCAMENHVTISAWLIIIAGIFDLIDGRAARMLKASSEFGEHFDTLSDLLSFGIAPAILFYQAGLHEVSEWGRVLCFFYALCVSFRLARFSVKSASGRAGFFQGLSSPVSASTAAALILFLSQVDLLMQTKIYLVGVTSFVLSLLMVSRLRFPTFKEMNWKSAKGILCLSVFFSAIAVVLFHPTLFLFIGFSTFICGIVVWNLVTILERDQSERV